MIASAAVLCLALNIYYEARGEPIEGQYAVAHVTINRAKHKNYPNDICQVVFQEKQFSWTLENNLKNPTGPSWDLAKSIATDALHSKARDSTNDGSTHFHATHVSPKWSAKLIRTKSIGGHIFYTNRNIVYK